jgi:hypothetical protein
MHVPFSYLRCPSCGSTIEAGTSIAPPDNGVPKTCSQVDQGSQRSAMFAPPFVLHTWKDIAEYLGGGVRTAQRWEHDLGLPVHRPHQRERSTVLAFPEEINQWLHRTPIGLPRKPALGSGNRTVHKQGWALNKQCG